MPLTRRYHLCCCAVILTICVAPFVPRDGGVCFVLKTARNQWIKARPAPPPPPPTNGNHSNRSNGGNGDGDTAAECDFWIPTSGLSLVGGGAVQLPDVFRMTHSDSLPMVGGQCGVLACSVGVSVHWYCEWTRSRQPCCWSGWPCTWLMT